jgi:NADPH:quinone reductase-like Zn-dependent oxidoreductase
VFDLLVAGKLKFEFFKEHYGLQEAVKAHEDLEGRKTTGKLLIRL